jgi:hypothetical protein
MSTGYRPTLPTSPTHQGGHHDADFGDFETAPSGKSAAAASNGADKWGELGKLVDLGKIEKNEDLKAKQTSSVQAQQTYANNSFAGLDGFSKTPQAMSAGPNMASYNRPMGGQPMGAAMGNPGMRPMGGQFGGPMGMPGAGPPQMGGYGGMPGATPMGAYGAPQMGMGGMYPPAASAPYGAPPAGGMYGAAPGGYPAPGYPPMGGAPQYPGNYPPRGESQHTLQLFPNVLNTICHLSYFISRSFLIRGALLFNIDITG